MDSNTSIAAAGRGGPFDVLREMYRSRVVWYLPLVLMTVSGAAIIIPYTPDISTNFFASQRAHHKVDCTQYTHENKPAVCIDAHGDATMWQASTSFMSNSVMCFLVAPVVGAASDVYGRKPFLIAATIMNVLPVLMLVLYNNLGLVSLYWYYPVSAIGGGINSISLTMAAIADTVCAQNRTAAFGMVMATSCLGFIIGPIVGATVPSPEMALNVSLVMCIFTTMFGVLVLTETKPTLKDIAPAERSLEAPLIGVESNESTAALKRKPKISFMSLTILGRSPLFRRLTVLVMFYMMIEAGVQGFIGQYLQLTLDFNKNDQALMFVVLGVTGIVVQFFLLGPLIQFFGERKLIVVGLVFQMVQQLAIAFAFSKVEAIMAVGVGALGMVTFPAISSLKSNGVDAHEQGQVQGALYGAQALAMGVGPLMFSFLFKAFTSTHSVLPYFPGAVFLISCALMVIPLGVAIDLCRLERRSSAVSEPPASSDE